MAISSESNNSTALTSTSFKIKDLLLRAWRERWSEIEWGRMIKRLLRGVSGDVYGLADCMLGQAINGPVTNQLIMLYLNHCLDSQIISFGACIMAIIKIPDLKPQCINSLLDFLIRYKNRTNCYGNDNECLALCRSLVSLLHWLYTITESSLKEIIECTSDDPSAISVVSVEFQICEKVIHLLQYIESDSYLKALLYIGKMEEQTLWKRWLELHHQLSISLLNSSSQLKQIEIFYQLLQNFHKRIEWLDPSLASSPNAISGPIQLAFQQITTRSKFSDLTYTPISFHSVRLVISFYAILDLGCSNDLLANYLAIIGRTFNISLSKLYCEILHTCLVGLIDIHSLANEDRKNVNYHAWIAFLLFKVPQIFLKLSKHRINLSKQVASDAKDGQESKNDLELGFDQLLEFGPCIDQFILRYKTEHLQKLLESFKDPQIGLLSPTSVDIYMKEINLRMVSSFGDTSSNLIANVDEISNGNSNHSTSDPLLSTKLIFGAEQTVTSILTPLYMDNCQIEPLTGIICLMQQSFDIILCAAASNDTLPKFAQRLMELNRSNASSRGENLRSSQIRAVLFDMTFISLCSIVERYGQDVIQPVSTSSNNSTTDGNTNQYFFFNDWCRWNIPGSNACFSSNFILSSYKDKSKYDTLIQQLIAPKSLTTEFRTSLVSWDEMCIAVQFATSEMLNAWCNDAVTTEAVKSFLDSIKSRLCFMALSAAYWLFAKMNDAPAEHQSKILYMLNELQVPLPFDQTTEEFAKEASESNLAFRYKQRFLLMDSTLKRLMIKFLPNSKLVSNIKPTSLNSLSIRSCKTPINTLLEKCLNSAKNHFTLKLVYDFDGLFSIGGPDWFVSEIVKHLFNSNNVDYWQDSVDMAYGLFHLDLEQCALVLLRHTLPQYLLSKSSESNLNEPKISALIRLAIITTYSALEQLTKFRQLNLPKRSGHRRNYQEPSELYPADGIQFPENRLEHTPFYYKQRDHSGSNKQTTPDTQSKQVAMDVDPQPDEISETNPEDVRWILEEPLYYELVSLFRLILQQSFEYEFSPWLLVPTTLLEQIVINLREDAPQFLQFISFNLLEAIIQSCHCRSLPFEQMLAFLVLNSVRSRKIAAKLICQLQLSKLYVHPHKQTHCLPESRILNSKHMRIE